MKRGPHMLVATSLVVLVGCSGAEPPAQTPAAPSSTTSAVAPPPPPEPVDLPLASEPARIADDLAADERTLRDPASSETALGAAARRQQLAYRVLGRHPEWDAITRPRIPPALLQAFDLNLDARRHLTALGEGAGLPDTVPAWRIVAPTPAADLLRDYREAEAAFGVGWAYLAAINLIETGFGRITGTSTAGAQGPMQFMPSTFAAYGNGGDINSPRDAIMAAGRYLSANRFADDRDNALYRYNNSDHYVRAVSDYAAVMEADPAAFAGYHRWEIYYRTTAGDIHLPLGYLQTTRIPVSDYRPR